MMINELKIGLSIWDTAEQEIFRSITIQYYRHAAGVLLVFDTTSKKSFLNIQYWNSIITKECSTNVVKILVGNKLT